MNAYGKPLSIISLAAAEQRLQAVVGRDHEASGVDEELAGDVEEDQEEVKGAEAEDHVDFWNAGLLLEVVEGWVPGQLLVELGEMVLRPTYAVSGYQGGTW